VQRAWGITLYTTEPEIEVQPPRAPDVWVGKIFDRNWELISAIILMALFRGTVERRFAAKVEDEIFKNLSRLTTQWEEAVHRGIHVAEKEARARLDEILATVRRLLATPEPERDAELALFLGTHPSRFPATQLLTLAGSCRGGACPSRSGLHPLRA
jgi:hypothetical protein